MSKTSNRINHQNTKLNPTARALDDFVKVTEIMPVFGSPSKKSISQETVLKLFDAPERLIIQL